MSRDAPRDEPPEEAVRAAATAALNCRVTGVARIDRGVNALYRVELADGSAAVLKAPLYAANEAFLAEPALLRRLGRESRLPVPAVRATVPPEDGPLDVACYVMEHVDGRQVRNLLALRPAARERLVREAGAHLAAMHDRRFTERYGHLQVDDGELVAQPTVTSWDALFAELANDVTAALRGEGSLSDEDPRFADLEPVVRDALGNFDEIADDVSPRPALVTRDYRPANLLLAESDDADPLVRGVVDVGGVAGDGLLDVAMTEDATIDAPLGGTDEAESLGERFRTAYAESRGADVGTVFDDRYPY